MQRHGDSRDVLGHFADVYLRARWYAGSGLMVTIAVIILLGFSSEYTWVIGLAGLVILVHSAVTRSLGTHNEMFAMIVDITATHAAILVTSATTNDPIGPAITVVTAAVLIGLFSEGWRRVALLCYSGLLTSFALTAAFDWDVGEVGDDIIGIAFVVTLVVVVISTIRSRLVELDASRAQMLGVVSHELRNHLAGVVGATEIINDETTSLSEGETTELLGMAHQQAVEAGEVIEDLLIASRAERGVLDAYPELVDVVPLTEAVVRRSSVDSVSIAFDKPDGPVWAIADPLRYRQVLRNILTNAVRYGGPEINVSIEAVGDNIEVVVADNGDGVDPSEVATIFQPYQQGSNSKHVAGSSGLGLWIARSLAQKMNGDIAYERDHGQTLFELTLPAGPEIADGEHADHLASSSH
jgi:signal transduction histidine kinase